MACFLNVFVLFSSMKAGAHDDLKKHVGNLLLSYDSPTKKLVLSVSRIISNLIHLEICRGAGLILGLLLEERQSLSASARFSKKIVPASSKNRLNYACEALVLVSQACKFYKQVKWRKSVPNEIFQNLPIMTKIMTSLFFHYSFQLRFRN